MPPRAAAKRNTRGWLAPPPCIRSQFAYGPARQVELVSRTTTQSGSIAILVPGSFAPSHSAPPFWMGTGGGGIVFGTLAPLPRSVPPLWGGHRRGRHLFVPPGTRPSFRGGLRPAGHLFVIRQPSSAPASVLLQDAGRSRHLYAAVAFRKRKTSFCFEGFLKQSTKYNFMRFRFRH